LPLIILEEKQQNKKEEKEEEIGKVLKELDKKRFERKNPKENEEKENRKHHQGVNTLKYPNIFKNKTHDISPSTKGVSKHFAR